ncbi:hypothetical protein BSTP3_092 [Bacillus phage BSTP3]|uniref:hypothetical protein n=1 Tax=Bacillus phage SPG24 TaxID=1497851 RepID=UPI001AFA7CEF|nr:hypothetical protein IM043_gp140 [Bacillus phage SPG24]QRI44638.1 hypothetical protein BSTP3_092 [Bacillus phage BSTP3]
MNLNGIGALLWLICGIVVLFFLINIYPFTIILLFCIVIPAIAGWVWTGQRIERERQVEDEFQRLQEENERLKRELDKDK